jgi:hypothetical protein
MEIDIPKELCILENDNPLLSLVDFVYPNVATNFGKKGFF